MLLCNETVTLVRHNKAKEGDSFTCTAIVGASWYSKAVIQPSAQTGGNGVQLANAVKVRIPEGHMPDGVLPQTGDYLVRGVIASAGGLDSLKGREYIKVMAVGDNRRGLLRHWAVSGA